MSRSRNQNNTDRNKFTQDVGIRGRKTGRTAKANVKQDDDGQENVSDFYDESTLHPGDADESFADGDDQGEQRDDGPILPDDINGDVNQQEQQQQQDQPQQQSSPRTLQEEIAGALARKNDPTVQAETRPKRNADLASPSRSTLLVLRSDDTLPYDDVHTDVDAGSVSSLEIQSVRKLLFPNPGNTMGSDDESRSRNPEEEDESDTGATPAKATKVRRMKKKGLVLLRDREGNGGRDAMRRGKKTEEEEDEPEPEMDDEGAAFNLGGGANGRRGRPAANEAGETTSGTRSGRRAAATPMEKQRGSAGGKKAGQEEMEEEDEEKEEPLLPNRRGKKNSAAKKIPKAQVKAPAKAQRGRGRPSLVKVPSSEPEEYEIENQGEEKAPLSERDTEETPPTRKGRLRSIKVQPNGKAKPAAKKGRPALSGGSKVEVMVREEEEEGEEEEEEDEQGGRTGGPAIVPIITKIIRVPSEDEEIGIKRKRHPSHDDVDDNEDARDLARGRKKPKEDPVNKPLPEGVVVQYGSGQEIRRPVIGSMLKPKAVNNQAYMFQKVFSEGEFMSSGIVLLPKGAEKPNKNSRASAMVFYVISGSVRVTIHKTTFVISTGGQFIVPRGNQYRIVNVANRESRLHFTQAREINVPVLPAVELEAAEALGGSGSSAEEVAAEKS
ncbi:Mif2/CENP-C like-domain-containing protein [Jimgerdemannia flammicorona]|uniref:CENP-C homolog n=1 Tax=Jimgerdemannia flammicorona TaxID=994334 RepID=A0A433DDI3_9FUNG|nr:Mif2/CENP-C like-domain-containing protein [Jimgerdemannia flammicorona]